MAREHTHIHKVAGVHNIQTTEFDIEFFRFDRFGTDTFL